jgi:hypothetical protein
MSNPSRDAGIPVLTEVIEVVEVIDETAAMEVPQPAAVPGTQPVNTVSAAPAMPPSAATVEDLEQRAIASMGGEDWARLERALRERILRQLLARADASLEQKVRDSLADVLQGAVSKLADEIRDGLHASLEDMILRAVSQEITRLRSGGYQE